MNHVLQYLTENHLLIMAGLLYLVALVFMLLHYRVKHFKEVINSKIDYIECLETVIGRDREIIHWNSSGILPPVWMKLIIDVDGRERHVKRTAWALSSDAQVDFECQDTGELITGRFKWRYP